MRAVMRRVRKGCRRCGRSPSESERGADQTRSRFIKGEMEKCPNGQIPECVLHTPARKRVVSEFFRCVGLIKRCWCNPPFPPLSSPHHFGHCEELEPEISMATLTLFRKHLKMLQNADGVPITMETSSVHNLPPGNTDPRQDHSRASSDKMLECLCRGREKRAGGSVRERGGEREREREDSAVLIDLMAHGTGSSRGSLTKPERLAVEFPQLKPPIILDLCYWYY
ncbi:hypothetical protein DNTS_033852 [Danionella cerebrum]|uniref:Uncharacterized protein n=1 Tax=Danionella cerebrum TaxID=2873325 RepID=A0A553QIG0_9TELE|nr:hypothetical protein DNTS_033852 [Danionella translucida]